MTELNYAGWPVSAYVQYKKTGTIGVVAEPDLDTYSHSFLERNKDWCLVNFWDSGGHRVELLVPADSIEPASQETINHVLAHVAGETLQSGDGKDAG